MASGCLRMRRAKVLMVGLDSAGKTTILYKLKVNELVATVPTYSYNTVKLDYKNIHYTVWDFGGRDDVRELWKANLQDVSGVIFVVDSTDRSRLSQASEELAALMSHPLLGSAVLLVLANKQDLPEAMNPSEIIENLRLSHITRLHQRWHLQPTDAIRGSGLYDGLDWMTETLLTYHHLEVGCGRCWRWCVCL